MQAFTCLSSTACTLLEDNVDTDVIFPARYLLRMEKQGLGRFLFHDRQTTRSGSTPAHSPLDRPGAAILVAGANFGCGSSREHAVWALADFGFRCIIAPSYGEIFYANCFNSGVLPIRLETETVTEIGRLADGGEVFHIDLAASQISYGNVTTSFEIDGGRREALLQGWDLIDVVLQNERRSIEAFEVGHAALQPWLFE